MNGNDLYICSYTSSGKIIKIDITDTNPTPIDIVTNLNFPYALALKGNDLFISERFGNKISKIDISDSNPTPVDVITGLDNPGGLAIYKDHLYFSESSGDKISKIDLSIQNPSKVDLVSGFNGNPTELLLSDNELYISVLVANKIVKIDLDDNTPEITDVVTNLSDPVGIALENDDLFISEFSAGKISKFNLKTLSLDHNYFIEKESKLFPNPSSDFLQISRLAEAKNYIIYNFLGSRVNSRIISDGEKINIKNLTNGLYFFKLPNHNIIKFLKK